LQQSEGSLYQGGITTCFRTATIYTAFPSFVAEALACIAVFIKTKTIIAATVVARATIVSNPHLVS